MPGDFDTVVRKACRGLQVLQEFAQRVHRHLDPLSQSTPAMPGGRDDLLGKRWHDWLFDQMRHVDKSNAFGIAQAPALAGAGVAIKNGWTEHSTQRGRIWAVNFLAIWGDWSFAVLTRLPS